MAGRHHWHKQDLVCIRVCVREFVLIVIDSMRRDKDEVGMEGVNLSVRESEIENKRERYE